MKKTLPAGLPNLDATQPIDPKALERTQEIEEDDLLDERLTRPADRPFYRCTICHESPVSPLDGEDTCALCLGRM